MYYLQCKKIETSIRRAKKDLIKIAKEEGLYDNFGFTEALKINDKFINISDYSDEMNYKRLQLKAFRDWCSNYKG